MLKSFFCSKRWSIWAWGGAAFLLGGVLYQVVLSMWFNTWYKEFYDLLQQGGTIDYDEGMRLFWKNIAEFVWLVIPYIFTVTVINWFARIYSLRWREAITFSYIPRWQLSTEDIEGASQRIQEDCAKWAEAIQGIGLQVLRASMLLIVFIPILYSLIGWLVWVAVGCSLGGMILSWFIGYFLPGLEYNNQKTEHAFRKDLVYAEDDRSTLSIATAIELFTGLRLNHQRLYNHYGYFDLWVTLFDQAMNILPYIVAVPLLMQGVITFGSLIQISNAFGKVQGSMSVFINNWTAITSVRSVHKRLKEFQNSI